VRGVLTPVSKSCLEPFAQSRRYFIGGSLSPPIVQHQYLFVANIEPYQSLGRAMDLRREAKSRAVQPLGWLKQKIIM
jgi:hypothetical protein